MTADDPLNIINWEGESPPSGSRQSSTHGHDTVNDSALDNCNHATSSPEESCEQSGDGPVLDMAEAGSEDVPGPAEGGQAGKSTEKHSTQYLEVTDASRNVSVARTIRCLEP